MLWELPFTNIYLTITPDMLYQIKKDVWEHLVNLTLEIIKRTYDSQIANLLHLAYLEWYNITDVPDVSGRMRIVT